ncbi:FAD dependent oxidoreductase [Biscogniauxia mediterranea]|nr:FAD dependent oxidoreductase [Biscogniauxia mediterranea]
MAAPAPSPPSPRAWGLPVPNPCVSFWQQTTRSFPYLHANRDAAVPSASIRYAVIGSGISGALTAFKLLESGVAPHEVAILEAREAASGASSRNAGHVRPDAFRGFAPYARLHGASQALKILASERETLAAVAAFVSEHGVACDFAPATTLDVCLTEEFAGFLADSYAAYREAGGDVSGIRVHATAEAARARSRVRGALAAYEWDAGSSHPAKLAQWLLRSCVERGVALFTHCPVTGMAEAGAEAGGEMKGRWLLETPRGTLRAETVIHCTNAHAAHLLPRLAPFLTPNRAQAHAVIPPARLAGADTLRSTMSLRHGLKHFYSVAQRPADGIVILGSSRANPNLSRETMAGVVSADDTKGFDAEIRDDALGEFWNLLAAEDGEEVLVQNGQVVGKGEEGAAAAKPSSLRHGEGLLHVWTGIIGMTTDSCPFIGRVPGTEGQWICAGFNGHGMARIFTCAPGLVKLIRGGQWSDTGLPECFELTEERLEKLKGLCEQAGVL